MRLPGTTPVENGTLGSCTAKVGAVLDAGSGPAILVGHSMGGMVITQAAAEHPSRVSRPVYVAAFLPAN